ncbi:putative hydrolase/metal-binding protein [Burkholderia pseudomallei]|nr:putative hydrolase/metal-binding protein [Burkholderia pseudomallei]
MLKGLSLTPPVVGRISIGRVTEKNGKRVPAADDQFTLTTQVQQRGEWLMHPLNERLSAAIYVAGRGVRRSYAANSPQSPRRHKAGLSRLLKSASF